MSQAAAIPKHSAGVWVGGAQDAPEIVTQRHPMEAAGTVAPTLPDIDRMTARRPSLVTLEELKGDR